MSVCILIGLWATAVIQDENGDPPAYWKNAAVIYARIDDVKKVLGDQYKLRLRGIATLTGEYDTAAENIIDVDVRIQWGQRAVQFVPPRGVHVIALIQRDRNGSYFIPDVRPRFLAAPEPLITVTGFDDPKVTETIENLRKLRGKQREEAEKAAASEKKK